MGRPLSLALLTTALAACIIGPACVDGFSSPLASSFGVCRGSAKLHSCSLPPRRSRAPLAPALRCSSEPTWDDGDKKEASVPAVDVPAQAVPEPNIEEVAEVATRSALQELADKARAKAEAGGIGGLGGGSGAFLWKEQLSRRMEEASATFEAVPLPGFNLASVGLKGRWTEEGGSYILDPPYGMAPVGVVHFLGGAFIGSAPHIAYRFFLELLADEGYIIVATPYTLSFDYYNVCAAIALRSEGAVLNARKRGPGGDLLPVVNVGHSGGCVLHAISDCLFRPSNDRTAAVYISFNNRKADGSIPQLEEVVAPAARALREDGPAQDTLKQIFSAARKAAEDATLDLAVSGVAPRSFGGELLQLAAEGFEVVEQVPSLLIDIAEDRKEFVPSVEEVAEMISTSYPCKTTLLLSFDGDDYDDSEKLLPIMAKSGCIVSALPQKLDGMHYTPLTQDPLISTPFDSFDPLLPLRRTARQALIEPLWRLRSEVVPYLKRASKN